VESFISISLILATIRISTPLILASLGGVISECAGVINIALEGTMLMGAFSSVAATYYTGNPWIGVLAAIIVSAVFATIHAIICVTFKANQVVSGVALNMLADGITVFMLRMLFNLEGISQSVKKLPQWQIINPSIAFNPIVYISIIAAITLWIVLYKTRLGLRIRAVGVYPQAVESAGVSVYKLRYFAVVVGGILAGLAGVHLSLGEGSIFVRGMTGGRGYIALAAMIFGKYNPLGATCAAILFGYFEALQIGLSGATLNGIVIPSQFIQMMPFVVAILVLAGFIGKATPPAADGIPYERGER